MASKRKRISYLPTATRRAVLYARYSSTAQADGWSIEAQVSELRAYCERMGWTALDEVCVDEAISGASVERPGLERAMEHIRQGRANVLVVHKLDRFFRDMAKTFAYVRDLEDMGAGLVCTQQPIDTTNPVSGKIVLAVMAALAEIYLDNLSDETAKGKRARAAAGLPNGDLPYGYVVSKQADAPHANNKATALVVPEEAEVVRLAFEWYATGQIGEAKIAHKLNERGYRMRSKRQPSTGLFTRDTVRCMLHNRFYAGWVHQPEDESMSWQARATDGRHTLGLHEPIVSQEAYDRAQRARADRLGGAGAKRRGTAPKRYHAAYLASGILRCKKCGQRMHGQLAGTGRAGYFCTWGYRGGKCAAKRKSIEAAIIDASIGAAVSGLELPAHWRDIAISETDHTADREARRIDERAALERKLARLKDLVIEGDISKEDYRAEKSRVEAELAQVAPSAEHIDRDRVAALMTDLQRLWKDASDDERRELAQQAFEAVYLDLDTKNGLHFILKDDLKPLAHLLPGCTGVTDGA